MENEARDRSQSQASVVIGLRNVTNYQPVVYDPLKTSHASEIFDFLYIGDYTLAERKDLLNKLGITAIINAAKECENHHPSDFKYINLHMEDWELQDAKQHFPKTFDFIEEHRKQNGKILVHCFGGVSRAPTMVLSYLMKHKQWTLLESLKHVKKSRDFIQPNEGFIQQLLEFEKELLPDKYPSVKLEDLDFDSD